LLTKLTKTDFTDEFFLSGIKEWLNGDRVSHDLSHVRDFKPKAKVISKEISQLAKTIADDLKTNKAIMGVSSFYLMKIFNDLFIKDIR
jgi:hypothetical protein